MSSSLLMVQLPLKVPVIDAVIRGKKRLISLSLTGDELFVEDQKGNLVPIDLRRRIKAASQDLQSLEELEGGQE